MKRKDEMVAYQLWLHQPVDSEGKSRQYWHALVYNMAMAFMREDDKFNATKFVEACEFGLKKWK